MVMMMQWWWWWWLLVDENLFVMEEMHLSEHTSVMDVDSSANYNEVFRFDDEFHCNTRLNHLYRVIVAMES